MQQCLRFLIREARAIDVACAWGTVMEKFSGASGGRNHFEAKSFSDSSVSVLTFMISPSA